MTFLFRVITRMLRSNSTLPNRGTQHRTIGNLVGSILVGAILIYSFQSCWAQGTKPKKPISPEFSYYVLVLSYAPSFCSQPTASKDPGECGLGRHLSFVVSGFWAQGATGRGLENCSNGPLAPATINVMLKYMPVASLIQHEWQLHGSCSGLSQDDFFSAVRNARDSLVIPSDLNEPSQQLERSPAQIESSFAAANTSFPAKAFRTSCYGDGTIQELRVCFDKSLSPRPCGSAIGECSLPTVKIPPVR
jgi:ribonuclease T2